MRRLLLFLLLLPLMVAFHWPAGAQIDPGKVFDLTGSYKAAFANGVAWSVINVSIAAWLLRRAARRAPA